MHLNRFLLKKKCEVTTEYSLRYIVALVIR